MNLPVLLRGFVQVHWSASIGNHYSTSRYVIPTDAIAEFVNIDELRKAAKAIVLRKPTWASKDDYEVIDLFLSG